MTPTRSATMPVDGRAADELRPLSFERDFTEMAAGSCLVSFGRTRVLCTASIDEDVPRWMRGKGKGWVTAEYSMLPGSSPERVDREAARGKQSGRTVEIQRLIGRSLRAACDMRALGERQVVVDCDVLQADGGTRTASICGGFLALHDALARLVIGGELAAHPLHSFCAAISVGIVGGVPVLDLPYTEDSTAEVDMNVVMLRPVTGGEPRFVEVQGTVEGMAFTRASSTSCSCSPSPGSSRSPICRRRWPRCRPPSGGDRERSPRGRGGQRVRLVCASANPDKVAEIRAILGATVELAPSAGRRARRRRGRRHARGQRPAQGIDIRPLREITGEEMFNEVFLDDVFVPDECVVGEVDGGWKLARTTLANERVAMSRSHLGDSVERALTLLGDDVTPAHIQVGRAVALSSVVSLLGTRATLRSLAGQGPGPESSVAKLVGVRSRQDAAELVVTLLGDRVFVGDDLTRVAMHELLLTRCLSIAGGTTQVLRNVAAERILGLPRDGA